MSRETDITRHPHRVFPLMASVAGATVLVMAAIGFAPAWQSGAATLIAMFAALAVAWLGSLAGLTPLALMKSTDPMAFYRAFMIGLSLRFLVTIGAAMWLVFATPIERTPLLIGVAVAQLVVLAADTALTTWLQQRGAFGAVAQDEER